LIYNYKATKFTFQQSVSSKVTTRNSFLLCSNYKKAANHIVASKMEKWLTDRHLVRLPVDA